MNGIENNKERGVDMLEYMKGFPVVIIPGNQVQVKTHKNRLINYLYKKKYGFKTVEKIEKGKVMLFSGELHMSRETYEIIEQALAERQG